MASRLFKKISAYFIVWICLVSSVNADQMERGKAVFDGAGMCASCHVLKAAGAEGDVGPSFDILKPTVAVVKRAVTEGIGIMPAFGADGILTAKEIDDVAFYVANSAGK